MLDQPQTDTESRWRRKRGNSTRMVVPNATLLLLLLVSFTVTLHALATTANNPAASPHTLHQPKHPSSSSSPRPPHASARGAAATAARFHSLTNSLGLSGPMSSASAARRRSGLQSRRAEREHMVMMEVVSQALERSKKEEEEKRREAAASHAASMDVDPASQAAADFHLLNMLMEKQSELREYGASSNERSHIAGLDRKFLQQVTDRAVNNALESVRRAHPGMRMRDSSDPLHLYGVRAPYNGPNAPASNEGKNDWRYRRRHSLYGSDEALNDPYLTRWTSALETGSDAAPAVKVESAAARARRRSRETGYATRVQPQLVFRLDPKSNELVAQREREKHAEYAQTHFNRQTRPERKGHKHHAHTSKKSTSTPHAKPAMPPTDAASLVKRAKEQLAAQQASAVAAPAKHAPSTMTEQHTEADDGKVAAGVFTELETDIDQGQEELAADSTDGDNENENESESEIDWDALHQSILAELAARQHHSQSDVAAGEAETSSVSSAEDESDGAVDPLELIELDSSFQGELEQMPLRELGILLGLNPNKKNEMKKTATDDASKQQRQHADAEKQKQSQQSQKADTNEKPQPSPSAAGHQQPQPSFTQLHSQTRAQTRSKEGGEAGYAEDAGDPSMMVGAGVEYFPSPLKHPPPPPVPPPPPPPPPPNFA